PGSAIEIPAASVGIHERKLTAPVPVSSAFFGRAVALSGDTAIVGASNEDGALMGAAYVFVRSGSEWIEQARLVPSDHPEGAEFGYSVAIDGDTAVVGADRAGPRCIACGAAYVFVRSGDSWTQQAKVTPPMSPVSGYFGKSVAVSGDTIVVGAPEAQTPAGYTGTAFVYVRSGTTWTEQSELIPHHLGAAPQFGLAVAVDGDTALVGALRDEGPGGQNS